MYPERQVWLIKDNASIHTKAEWTAAQFRVTARIRKAPWPPNSPDLHPIENLWDYEKDIIRDKPVHGASESEKKQIKELATKEWLAMDSKVKQCIGTFKDRLERCIKANGDNNFRGWDDLNCIISSIYLILCGVADHCLKALIRIHFSAARVGARSISAEALFGGVLQSLAKSALASNTLENKLPHVAKALASKLTHIRLLY